MAKMALYTGYFKELNKYIEEGLLPVSISRFSPDGYSGDELKGLAPSEDLLKRYKANQIGSSGYKEEYLAYLASKEGMRAIFKDLSKDIYQKALDGGYKGVVLMCYEKPDEFCHRHLLADYLKEKYQADIKEYDEATLEKSKEEVPAEQIEQKMYGSTHTHFESLYDTANNLEDMLKSFASLGAKKVAVTEHGEFTSFEDLKDIAADMDIKVIPGVEGYLGENKEHLILIAKNAEGYRELSNIISDSNVNHNDKNQPIMTMEMLKKHITPGNVICTSACIQGPFGKIFVDDMAEKERLKQRYLNRLAKYEGSKDEILAMEEEYASLNEKARKALSAEDKASYKANHSKYLAIKRNNDKLQEIEEAFETVPTLEEKIDEARDLYLSFCDIFGSDNFYLEIQNHGIDKEQEIYSGVVNFARIMGITDKLIAANDVHVGRTSKELKERNNIDFLNRQVSKFCRFNKYQEYEDWEKEIYIKSDEELKETLMKLPGIKEEEVDLAIGNIEHVLEPCETEYLYPKEMSAHYPKFCEDENELFDRLVDEGIRLKFPDGFPSEEYQKRLDYEKKIIKDMGYAGYHLIVQDYLDYARYLGYLPKEMIADAPLDLEELKELTKGYPHNALNIGPGRGSGVGSLCCYALGITDIDPLKYNLLFERFLNPERVSMPDIDADFRTDIRDKCIEYCAYKYGRTGGTCKIVTKSYGKIKGNLRLAARFLGSKDIEERYDFDNTDLSSSDIGKIEEKELKPWYQLADKLSKSVDDNIEDIPDEVKSGFSQREKEIYTTAKGLGGLFTRYGQHAAGTIISGDKLEDILPMKWNKDKENYETQCTMAQAEAKGLLKMDFLGLENLDILTELMRETGDCIITDYAKRNELLNNKEVIRDIFDTGLTHGVFQFESDGMKQMLRDFKPDSFEDLILLNAGYRPGPMQYLPEVIAMKKYQDGRSKVKPEPKINIDSDTLKEILAPTYGCIIYQEQVMMICQKLAGFTMGHADNVRKFMSKKKEDKLAHERIDFVKGCKEVSGIAEKDANELFDQMMEFAKYAFNKSHATAYTLVAFFTAYYKKYYPAKFYAIAMNHLQKLEELSGFRSELSKMHITLSPPVMGKSQGKFTAEGSKIYFGYKGIKGMSEITLIPEDNIEDVIYNNPKLSAKVLSKLAVVGTFKELGKVEDVVSYIESYTDALRKKRETEEKLERLLRAETLDNRKISGARKTLANIGEIPTFEAFVSDPEHVCVISPDKIAEDAREMLGTVFLSKTQENYLKRFPSFAELEDEPVRRGFYLISVEEKEGRFKNGNPYHNAWIMDGDYTTKRIFLPEVLESGFYTGPVSAGPFDMLINDLSRFHKTVVKQEILEQRTLVARPKSDLAKRRVIESFRDALKVSANGAEQTVVYSGDQKLGMLSKEGEDAMRRDLLERNISVDKDYTTR